MGESWEAPVRSSGSAGGGGKGRVAAAIAGSTQRPRTSLIDAGEVGPLLASSREHTRHRQALWLGGRRLLAGVASTGSPVAASGNVGVVNPAPLGNCEARAWPLPGELGRACRGRAVRAMSTPSNSRGKEGGVGLQGSRWRVISLGVAHFSGRSWVSGGRGSMHLVVRQHCCGRVLIAARARSLGRATPTSRPPSAAVAPALADFDIYIYHGSPRRRRSGA